jgi:hypothetical protein
MKIEILIGICISSILLLSSCSMIMAPNLTAYHFKEKNELRISPAIGSSTGAEIQVAWSPLKHFFIKSGFRYEQTGQLGYSDIINYSCGNAGLGFYTWVGSSSYFQFCGEYILGSGNSVRPLAGMTLQFLHTDMRINGPAISGLYTAYSRYLEIGIGIGMRIGPMRISELNTSKDYYLVPNSGKEITRNSTYQEYSFSIFHMFKNQGSVSVNFGRVVAGDKKSIFAARLGFQFPINLTSTKVNKP